MGSKEAATALFEAVGRNDVEGVRQLLETGGDVNARDEEGMTPLHRAVYGGQVEMVQLLLERKAKVNAVDNYSWTARQLAVHRGYGEIADLIGRYGGREIRRVSNLWLQWFIAVTAVTMLSILGGNLIAQWFLTTFQIETVPINSNIPRILQMVNSVLFGILLVIVQWFILRRIDRFFIWWIPASVAAVVGTSGLFLLLEPISKFLMTEYMIPWIVSVIFLSILNEFFKGTVQWLVLRKIVYRAGWWIPTVMITSLTWIGIWYGTRFFYRFVGGGGGVFSQILEPVSKGIMQGAIVGAVTGGVLVWLMQRPKGTVLPI